MKNAKGKMKIKEKKRRGENAGEKRVALECLFNMF